MPHWMEAIHNEIPEEERDELKITLKYGNLAHVCEYVVVVIGMRYLLFLVNLCFVDI